MKTVKVDIARCLESTTKDKKFLLTNGRFLVVPKTVLKAEEPDSIYISEAFALRKQFIISEKSKYGDVKALNKESARALLVARRRASL
jgi:hypothetical protein